MNPKKRAPLIIVGLTGSLAIYEFLSGQPGKAVTYLLTGVSFLILVFVLLVIGRYADRFVIGYVDRSEVSSACTVAAVGIGLSLAGPILLSLYFTDRIRLPGRQILAAFALIVAGPYMVVAGVRHYRARPLDTRDDGGQPPRRAIVSPCAAA